MNEDDFRFSEADYAHLAGDKRAALSRVRVGRFNDSIESTSEAVNDRVRRGVALCEECYMTERKNVTASEWTPPREWLKSTDNAQMICPTHLRRWLGEITDTELQDRDVELARFAMRRKTDVEIAATLWYRSEHGSQEPRPSRMFAQSPRPSVNFWSTRSTAKVCLRLMALRQPAGLSQRCAVSCVIGTRRNGQKHSTISQTNLAGGHLQFGRQSATQRVTAFCCRMKSLVLIAVARMSVFRNSFVTCLPERRGEVLRAARSPDGAQ